MNAYDKKYIEDLNELIIKQQRIINYATKLLVEYVNDAKNFIAQEIKKEQDAVNNPIRGH